MGCPGTHYVDQIHKDPPASPSTLELVLKVYATLTGLGINHDSYALSILGGESLTGQCSIRFSSTGGK